jgi:hypothetical protein
MSLNCRPGLELLHELERPPGLELPHDLELLHELELPHYCMMILS